MLSTVLASLALALSPPNVGGSDACTTAEVIGGFGTYAFSNLGATTGLEGQTSPLCDYFGTPAIANDVWFHWIAPLTGTTQLQTCAGTAIDTKVAVYAGGTCAALTPIACNDDDCGLQSTVCFPVVAGSSYLVQLGSYPGSATGSGTFTIGASLPPNLVAWYRFDGGNLLTDSSGNGHTLLSASGLPFGTGACSSAPEFNPANNLAELWTPDHPALDLTGAMTGMAWVFPYGAQSDGNPGCPEGTICWKGGNYWFQIAPNNDQVLLQNEGSGNFIARWPATPQPGYVPVNTWTHLAFVRSADTRTIRFYKNGILEGESQLPSNSILPTANASELAFGNGGCCPYQDFCEFNGRLDEIRLFDGALSDCQVASEYASTRIPVAPTSIQASATSLCSGGSATLTAIGGSGDLVRWFSGSCGGTNLGVGATLNVTPTSTTTYFARWEIGGCGVSTCAQVTVTIASLAPPSSASATSTSVCSGTTVSLSAAGGIGDVLRWYAGGCGTGTSVGSGTPLNVSPTSTTTYFARWERAGCTPSACVSVTVTVTQPPVAPTSITAGSTSICAGSPVTLTANGGSGTTLRWYAGGCGAGASLGTSASINVAPTSTTTYFARWERPPCAPSACASVTVTVVQPPAAPSSASATQTSICSGASTSLSAVGGSGAILRWYAGGCGTGTSIGSGSTLTVSPSSTTVYFARWESPPCGPSACASVTVTVTASPVAPTSAQAVPDVLCAGAGGTVTLSATGGSGAALRWYANACGGTSIATGTPVTIAAPASDTTYYARWETGACVSATCASTSVTVLPVPANDPCANAEVLTAATTLFDTRCATDSAPLDCAIRNGVFHSFTMPACASLTFQAVPLASGFTPEFAVSRDGCSGSLLACSAGGTATVQAEAGAMLLIHTGSLDGSTGTGALLVSGASLTDPVNDEVTAAELIPAATTSATFALDTTCATDSSASGCAVRKDVWFRYDATLCRDVTLSITGASFPIAMAVYGGADCTSASLVACGGSPLVFQAQSGSSYSIRIGSSVALGGPATLDFAAVPCGSCASCPPPTIPERIQVYVLTGPATGTGWSWSLAASHFCGVTVLSVPPVASGTACDVAARFKDSILGVGCGSIVATSGCLPPVGSTPARGTLTIRMGGNQPFTLRTGPDCQAPNCTLTTLGGCTVNPFMIEWPLSGADCNQNGVDDVVDVAENTSFDVDGDFVPDECALPVRYCSGDGSATACPCGNPGAPGHGCDNSLGGGGARLDVQGVASVTIDTLRLDLLGVPAVASVLFFQGTARENGGAGSLLGDGLLCTSGALIRLGARTASGGVRAFGAGVPGDPLISIRGQIPSSGVTRTYQAWYRNAANFCTASTFNLSNGIEVLWLP